MSRMNGKVVYDVVMQLIGPINPLGETRADEMRYESLKELIVLVDGLLGDISKVCCNKNRAEYSMKKAGKAAYEFLSDTHASFHEED